MNIGPERLTAQIEVAARRAGDTDRRSVFGLRGSVSVPSVVAECVPDGLKRRDDLSRLGTSLAANSTVVFMISERTQYGNLGDIVLNSVLLEALARHGQVVTVRGTERPPRALEQVLARTTTQRLSRGRFVRYAIRSLLSGERWVLCLNPGGYRGGLTAAGVVRPFLYAAARLVGIRLLRVGISLGPLTRARRYQERLLARLIDLSAVRDRQSLAELGALASAHVRQLPDLALMSSAVAAANQPVRQRPLLVVSLRLGRKHAMPERLSFFADVCTELAGLALRNGLRLAFVAQVSGDVPVLAELARRMGAQFDVLDTDDPAVLEKVGALYGEAAIMVTNRLHAGIFAAMNGCVPIAFVDPLEDSKITGLLEDAGLSGLVVAEEDVSDLVTRSQDVLDQRDVWARRLRRATRWAALQGRRELDHMVTAVSGAFSGPVRPA